MHQFPQLSTCIQEWLYMQRSQQMNYIRCCFITITFESYLARKRNKTRMPCVHSFLCPSFRVSLCLDASVERRLRIRKPWISSGLGKWGDFLSFIVDSITCCVVRNDHTTFNRPWMLTKYTYRG